MEPASQFTTNAQISMTNQNAFAVFFTNKLNENNFKAWKKQALACIKINKLQNHLNPAKIPTKFNSESDRINENESQEYAEWEVQDQWLVAWLIASMEPSFVNRVIECEYAFQIWITLEEYFTARVKTRIKQLKTQLRTLKKHNSIVMEYRSKINQVADLLKALGAPLSREEFIEATLAGLGEEYNILSLLQQQESTTSVKASLKHSF
ncbi:uncharacterized protein [Arachis hypogaea]|uniref:uncharacterized protein n=1 Tax=Arachis hypogaea TaxID=3818 RepID=UPI003B20DF3B